MLCLVCRCSNTVVGTRTREGGKHGQLLRPIRAASSSIPASVAIGERGGGRKREDSRRHTDAGENTHVTAPGRRYVKTPLLRGGGVTSYPSGRSQRVQWKRYCFSKVASGLSRGESHAET